MKKTVPVAVVLVFCTMLTVPLLGQERVERKIVALYSSNRVHQRPDQTATHRMAEMPLNHLGLHVRYWDLDDGLPPDRVTENARGILVWKRDVKPKRRERYGRWLLEQLDRDRKLVVLGGLNLLAPSRKKPRTLHSLRKRIYRRLGLEFKGNLVKNPQLFSIRSKDRNMVGFERSLSDALYRYIQLRAAEGTRSYLTLHSDRHGPSDVVATSSAGGFALEHFYLYDFVSSNRTSWIVDPFRFFRNAFDAGNLPVPNTKLASGNRLLMSSIDGDGYLMVSRVDTSFTAGRILFDRIFKKYDDVPVAISFIGTELSREHRGSKKDLKLARKIASLPHVEGASHTWTHPFDWDHSEIGTSLEGALRPNPYAEVTNSNYSLEEEINGSVSFLNEHVFEPVGKSVDVFLWSGDCRPPRDAFRRLAELGIPNLNGGEYRLDREFPSLTNVSPLSRPVGPYRQPYVTGPNEFVYTDGWKRNHHAIRKIVQTWRNTDRDRLLKPVHLYYHFYIAQRKASLDALEGLYEYLEKQTLTPVFPSTYARMVLDFHDARVFRTADGYRLENWGRVRTATFQGQTTHPDLERSSGVIGYSHRKGNTHIFLSDRDTHRLVLKDTPPDAPYVAEANGWIHTFEAGPDGGRLTVEGLGDTRITIAGLPATTRFRFRDRTVSTGEDGRLQLSISLKTPDSRTIEFKRKE